MPSFCRDISSWLWLNFGNLLPPSAEVGTMYLLQALGLIFFCMPTDVCHTTATLLEKHNFRFCITGLFFRKNFSRSLKGLQQDFLQTGFLTVAQLTVSK